MAYILQKAFFRHALNFSQCPAVDIDAEPQDRYNEKWQKIKKSVKKNGKTAERRKEQHTDVKF